VYTNRGGTSVLTVTDITSEVLVPPSSAVRDSRRQELPSPAARLAGPACTVIASSGVAPSAGRLLRVTRQHSRAHHLAQNRECFCVNCGDGGQRTLLVEQLIFENVRVEYTFGARYYIGANTELQSACLFFLTTIIETHFLLTTELQVRKLLEHHLVFCPAKKFFWGLWRNATFRFLQPIYETTNNKRNPLFASHGTTGTETFGTSPRIPSCQKVFLGLWRNATLQPIY
jgi:hypothetical protein